MINRGVDPPTFTNANVWVITFDDDTFILEEPPLNNKAVLIPFI